MARKIVVGCLAVVVAAGAVAVAFRHDLHAKWTLSRLRAASTDPERTARAEAFVATADASVLARVLRDGDDSLRLAVIAAVAGSSNDALTIAILDIAPSLDGESLDAAMALATRQPEAGRVAVTAALAGTPAAREAACRIAPALGLGELLVPLLADPSSAVRTAAVMAVGPMPQVVNEEALFRLLSDADGEVCLATASVLAVRGLTERQIALGRKLGHADPAERLALLVDLKHAAADVPDIGPWLARLGQDADPAVRAGAARVAFECRIAAGAWLDDLADRDADPLVRSVAGHYRGRAKAVRAAGGFEP